MIKRLLIFLLLLSLFATTGISNLSAAGEKRATSFECVGAGPWGTVYFLRENGHQAHYRWDGIDRNTTGQIDLYLKVTPVNGFGGSPCSASVKVGLLNHNGTIEYQNYTFANDVYQKISIPNAPQYINDSNQFHIYLKWNGLQHIGVESTWAYVVTTVSPDSDGDGLSDALERAGWDVVVYRIRTGEIVKTVHVTSNPARKDTDGDGLDDNIEYLKSDPNQPDTDADGLRDSNDDVINGIENQAPDITNFGYSGNIGRSGLKPVYKINVRIKATDQNSSANISKIEVKVSSAFDSSKRAENDGDYNQTHNINFFSGAVISGFTIEVWITDKNGNVRYEKRQLQSMVEWVAGGVNKTLDYAIDHSVYYEIKPFPRMWQGPYGLCAACSLLEIAYYYLKPSESFETLKSKSGEANILDGMFRDSQRNYLQAIRVYQREYLDAAIPSFTDIKGQIAERHPIFAAFHDYYNTNSDEGHAVVVIGFLDGPGERDFLVIQDSNVAVTSYLLPWSYLRSHYRHMFFTQGIGMNG